MKWKLSEEQDAYRESLRDWLGAVAPNRTVRTWLEEGDAETFEERLVRDGMSGGGIPEELGGQGGGVVELALTVEELARAAVPSATWMATVLAAQALTERPDLVEASLGRAPIVMLLPAEEVPATVRGLQIDEEGRVTGSVPRVLAGDRATAYVVPVGDGNGGGRRLVLVDAAADGVTATARALLDRSRSVADVVLESAPSVPLDVDTEECLAVVTDLAAVLTAADALGASERMLHLAVEYSLQRRQFGVPIGSFQAVKHAAATILVGVESGRSGVYFAAASVEGRDPECALHAAAVKAQVTAEAVRAGESALTIHGAIGYTWEHDLHLFHKRVHLDECLFGRPATWNERIADALVLV